MAEFSYRAADSRGLFAEGRIEAADAGAATTQLRARGLTPVSLQQLDAVAAAVPAAVPGGRRRAGRAGALRHADIHSFTSELAVMLRAGLPLDRSLRVLASMAEKPALAELLADILRAVKGGQAFSQALQPHQRHFGDFYLSMVRSGEASGHLDEVLARLAEHLERLKALRESVISALIYPAILLVVAALSVFFMLGFVVPSFENLFSDMGEALPLPTRAIVALGHLFGDWWWLILAGGAGLVWLLRRWLRGDAGSAWRDRSLLRLPMFGSIVRKYELTRFARSMGTLLGNGVPIVSALRIAADTVGNRILRAAFATLPAGIKQGARLGDTLAATGLMTPLALNMVRLGEETGRLDAMLLELARVYDSEVESGVKRALTFIEPVLILVLGGLIAAIIIALLMGILSVNDLAG